MPGSSPSWNLWLYSKYFTTRKIAAQSKRDHAGRSVSAFCLLCCGRVDRHHHRETGHQENDGVQRAEPLVEMVVRFEERLRVRRLLQSEAHEQSAEHQNFGREEQPHADLRGIELLLESGEVVLQPRIVLGVMLAALDLRDDRDQP